MGVIAGCYTSELTEQSKFCQQPFGEDAVETTVSILAHRHNTAERWHVPDETRRQDVVTPASTVTQSHATSFAIHLIFLDSVIFNSKKKIFKKIVF